MLTVKLCIASFSLLAAVVTAQPVFTLDCNTYPDVCDNHCNAAFCHGFDNPNAFLHYDPNSNSDMPNPGTQVTAATYRRNAIGCGSGNYCSGTGNDCDEFPYASTYDGGLGCIVARYTGTDPIAQSGTTRCANPTQNSQHGNAIGQFYSNEGLADGAQFQVAFDPNNVDNAPLCADLRGPQGTNACPDESTGDYRFRSTPQSDFCPSRAARRRRFDIPGLRLRENHSRPGNSSFHSVKDSDGNEVIVIHGPRPVPGTRVWRMTPDGKGAVSTIVG